MRFVKESDGQPITVNPRRDKLGAGGEGTVYGVGKDFAAKVFKQPETRRDKVFAMLANPPTDDSTPGHDSIAWPLDALLEPGPSRRFVGYLMKRVEKAGSFREVAHFKNRLAKRSHFTSYELHVVALNVASAFKALHGRGYVVGDVNDRNILVGESGLVTLLDTDSFQVPRQHGGGFFRCPVKTPEFTPPELQTVNPRDCDRTVEHDLFGLGVLLFQLLMQGNHPFNGTDDDGWTIPTRIEKGNFPFGQQQRPIRRPPHAPPLSVLGDELGELFVRCFEQGASDPAARPSAREWRRALDRAGKDLVECKVNENHRHPSAAAECPWCRIRREVKLKGGGGLDYFPDAHAQMPLSKPARQRVLGGASNASGTSSASSASSASSSLPAPTNLASLLQALPSRTPAATPPAPLRPPAGAAAGPPPTFADLALRALGAVASAYLSNRRGVGQLGPAAAAMQDEIVPGGWELRLTTPVPPMTPGPLLLGAQLQLAADGTFAGSGMLVNAFVRSPCHLAGQWRYEPHSRTLRVSTVVNGMPIGGSEELRVTGGGGGQLQVVAGDGRTFAFRRVA